jgi:phosphate transport system protein
MLPHHKNRRDDIQEMIITLLQQIISSNRTSLEAYMKREHHSFAGIKAQLKTIHAQAQAIDRNIINTLALVTSNTKELHLLICYLKITGELLCIGEGVKGYAQSMKAHLQSASDLTPLDNTIIQLHKSSINALQYLLECFEHFDACHLQDYYRKVMVEESKNNDLFSIVEKEILALVDAKKEGSSEYVKLLWSLKKLELSCDRSVTIANLMLTAKNGGDVSTYH